jgi:hypothetical protein
MRLHQIKITLIISLLFYSITAFTPGITFAQIPTQDDRQCCPLKFKTEKTATGDLICCNGPNDQNGFSEECCKAQDGKVHGTAPKQKCCLNQYPQTS